MPTDACHEDKLYVWVCASYDYWHVYQEIQPLQLEADAAAEKLAESIRIRDEKASHLQTIEEQLAVLQDSFNSMLKEQATLEDRVSQTETRIARAKKLLQGLTGESKRWE